MRRGLLARMIQIEWKDLLSVLRGLGALRRVQVTRGFRSRLPIGRSGRQMMWEKDCLRQMVEDFGEGNSTKQQMGMWKQ